MTRTGETTFDDRADVLQRSHLREIQGEAPPQTVGQDLRAARLRRADDLAAVSRMLRIRKDHLQAIEESRLEDLPGRTYAVGFVRSYAEYLGLKPAELVERFKSEIAGRSDGAPQVGLAPEPSGGGLPYGWLMMAVLVAAVVVYGAWHLVRSADLAPAQSVVPVPARIASALPQKSASPARRPAPVLRRPVHPPAPMAVVGGPIASGTAATGPGAVPGSTPTSPAAARATPELAALPPGQVFGKQNKNVRVILHARAVTRVLVQGPGGRVYINRILHPGDAYRVPDLVGLSLTTPDGGAVSLELDGQDLGLAGRAGQMTEALSLDPQAVVDRTGRGNPG